MSNISQTSKDLKKKLSFDDYSAPASQQAGETVGRQVADLPARQHSGIDSQVGQHDSMRVDRDAVTSNTANQSTGLSTNKRHAGKSATQQASAKIKATFYLSEDDHQALTSVFIKRLQERKKTDRSALIAEAINLLYRREMR